LLLLLLLLLLLMMINLSVCLYLVFKMQDIHSTVMIANKFCRLLNYSDRSN
jgi:hypothetical protein